MLLEQLEKERIAREDIVKAQVEVLRTLPDFLTGKYVGFKLRTFVQCVPLSSVFSNSN